MNITNTYSKTVSLTLSKQVKGASALVSADAGKEFKFDLTLTDRDGNPLTGTYPVTISDGGSVVNLSVTTKNGVQSITVKMTDGTTSLYLKDGDWIRIDGLPAGYSYSITESQIGSSTIRNYQTTVLVDDVVAATDTSRTVSKNSVTADTTIQYINRRTSLTLTKLVTGDYASTSQEFTFTLTLCDSSGTPLANQSYNTVASAIDGVSTPNYAYVRFDENGQASITLIHGQSLMLTDLPDGYQYTIKEEGLDAEESQYNDQALFYEAQTRTVVDGTAGEYVDGDSVSGTTSGTDADVQVEYLNTRITQNFNIGLSKTVTGQFGDLKKAFTFEISLKDRDGNPVSESFDVETSSIDGVEQPTITGNKLTFTEGKAEVLLKHGQGIKILAVPEGYTYEINEVLPTDSLYMTTYYVQYEKNVSSKSSSKRRVGPQNFRDTDTGEREVVRNETVEYTNTMPNVVPTGIHTNVAQHAMFFGLLILLVGIACTFRARRRSCRRQY
jgi:hypothetical protein